MSNRPPSQVSEPRCRDLVMLAEGTPEGCFVEVGVYKGGSAWHLYQVAQKQGRKLHLFDTFSGMPFQDTGDQFPQGSFFDTKPETVQSWMPLAILHVGTFPATMHPAVKDVAFAHFDCDQYRSTRDCIHEFLPRMVDGGIMAFDDYPEIPGVVKAVNEVFREKGVWFTDHKFAHVRLQRSGSHVLAT